MKNNKGFSLVELIVVVAIMSIMGGFIFISFGLLTGQDARECANNLSTILDKEKNYALTKSAEADCYVEIEKTSDGYTAKYFVPKKAVGTDMILAEEAIIGKESVVISGYYDSNFNDANPAILKRTLTTGKKLKIMYDRTSGEFKQVEMDGTTDINVIAVEKGRRYDLCLYIATGKHTLERTD